MDSRKRLVSLGHNRMPHASSEDLGNFPLTPRREGKRQDSMDTLAPYSTWSQLDGAHAHHTTSQVVLMHMTLHQLTSIHLCLVLLCFTIFHCTISFLSVKLLSPFLPFPPLLPPSSSSLPPFLPLTLHPSLCSSSTPPSLPFNAVCHAEVIAIMHRGSPDLESSTVYVTRFPCKECATMLVQFGIKEVVYADDPHPEREEYSTSRLILNDAMVMLR